MKGIIRAEQLPLDDQVFLKKSMFGWKVVYPLKNEDGTLNWFNILTGGSWANLILIALIVGTICFGTWAHYHDLNTIRDSCLLFKNNVVQGAAQTFQGIN